jgi:hypothetical protein
MTDTGVFDGIPMPDYISLDAFSAGLAFDILNSSPYHAKYERDNPSAPSKESDLGVYAHAMLLEGGIDCLQVIDAEDYRTKLARELRDAARAEGKLPILAIKLPEVKLMVKAAHEYLASSELAGILDSGKPEQTLVWKQDGLLCKARPDWLNQERTVLMHYKTTAGSAEPGAWQRTQLVGMGYDLAAVLYERGAETELPGTAWQSVFLVQEQKPPYACSLTALTPQMAQIANAKLARAMATWAECLKNGRFPAYPTAIQYAEPKAWQLYEAEEKGYAPDVSWREQVDLGGQA